MKVSTGLLQKHSCKRKGDYPLTYLNLPWYRKAYKRFDATLNEKQYHPPESPHNPENRLFGQFHSPQTCEMKEATLSQLCSKKVNEELFLQ